MGKKEHRWEELARACGWLGRVVGLRMELYLCGGCGSVRDIVYFEGRKCSKKFEIKIVGKKEYR